MAEQKLTAQERGDLNEVLGEILEILFAEADEQIAERTGKPGARIPYSDRIKIDLASKILALTKRYDAEARFGKFVECSNVIIPCLTKLFGAQRIASKLPPRARDERLVALCDKAGASELSALIRGSMGQERLAQPA